MNKQILLAIGSIVTVSLMSACGGDSSPDIVAPATGTISVSITDDPWHEMDSMVIRITGMEFGHSNGDVHSFDMPGGPIDVDMMQLQNGTFQGLISDLELPTGDYHWMRVQIDAAQSYMQDAGTGGQHERAGHPAEQLARSHRGHRGPARRHL